MSEQPASASPLLPIFVVTGFLGSGKTSFISHMLKNDGMSNSAVIINEFGEIGLDHLLVDSVEEQIIDLPNGCLCCNSSGALIEKLMELWLDNDNARIEIDRVIIETSGITDTTNLIQFLWSNIQIRQCYKLAKIITTVSASEWKDTRQGFPEVEKQLAISDVAIITKAKLLSSDICDVELAHLITEIEMVSPDSDKYTSPLSTGDFGELFTYDRNWDFQKVANFSQSHNTNAYKTCTLELAEPVSIQTITLFLGLITTRYSKKLLRVKGLVSTIEAPLKPLVIQVVKSTINPYSWLDKWPRIPLTQIVVIHTHSDNLPFTDLFNSVTNKPVIDQPDNLALSDNPLSITGLGKFNPH